jgi:PAS domain S-box-containing protein
MTVLVLLHDFWHFIVLGGTALGVLGDAATGWKVCRATLGKLVHKMFGFGALKDEIRGVLAEVKESSNRRDATMLKMDEQLQLIAAEMKPNGGHSMRDVINRVESRLVLQDERAKAIANDSAEALMEMDATGAMVWCNRTYSRMVGRDKSELMGWGFLNTIDPRDRERVKDEWLEAVQNGIAYENTERKLRPDGKVFTVNVITQPLRSGGSGKVVGFIATMRPSDAVAHALEVDMANAALASR